MQQGAEVVDFDVYRKMHLRISRALQASFEVGAPGC